MCRQRLSGGGELSSRPARTRTGGAERAAKGNREQEGQRPPRRLRES